ncbi:hypothetical protein SAMN05660461_0246 [Chitinophaga ginsengisegetis]|uniref:Fasciclin domain-containing protein n=1 Tax=Chitinophaga ginsengisegetis TaxID=393003 RepID=A0A1T5N511_9BACT|nr:hypothetical protein [Chitinophaga ginsengisegetis]SKC95128.1 hypothetical protein SAMN05660461_0246 [Chitinophaga ginsengisegetis]
MKHKIYLSFIALVAVVLFSCKKEYTIGGSLHDPHVNMTTYDYLKTNPLFDTVVLMIDKTGLKEEVNATGTFFAITDYDLSNYINLRQELERTRRVDPNYIFTFDSLDFGVMRDSLRAYLFKDLIPLDKATKTGKLYKANDGELRLVQGIPSRDYTDGSVFTQYPVYLYLTKLIAKPGYPVPVTDADLANTIPEQYLQTRCQTTGILTTNGILHVLNNNHTFTYFADTFN